MLSPPERRKIRDNSTKPLSNIPIDFNTSKFADKEPMTIQQQLADLQRCLECIAGSNSYINDEILSRSATEFGIDEAIAKQMLYIVDYENKGNLSVEEFVNRIAGLCRRSWKDQTKFCFQLYDLNGDGDLSSSELRISIARVFYSSGAYQPEASADKLADIICQKYATVRGAPFEYVLLYVNLKLTFSHDFLHHKQNRKFQFLLTNSWIFLSKIL